VSWLGLGWVKLALMAAAVSALLALYAWRVHAERETGRTEIRAEWTAAREKQKDEALAQSQANARETLRRLERQKENQDALDKLTAQAAADRARADVAGRQLRAAAARYAAAACPAAGNPAPGSISAPAGADPGMLAIVLSRIDDRAGILAAHADTSRAAGLKCSSDYDALTPP
jgi:hypothetical protein